MEEKRIKELMKELATISEALHEHGTIKFRDVLKAKSGKDVIKLKDFILFSRLEIVSKEFIDDYNINPQSYIKKYHESGSKVPGRVNEFGNMIEKIFIDFLDKSEDDLNHINFSVQTGYPDGHFTKGTGSDVADEEHIYIEIKTFGNGKEKSTMRSFYYSMGQSNKIKHNGQHLLVAFETSKEKSNFDAGDGRVVKLPSKLTKFIVIDLYDLDVNFKAEFNIGNKGLYEKKGK